MVNKQFDLNDQRGLSLLECMLALSLGVGLIYMVSILYISLSRAHCLQQGIIEIQQHARVAFIYLTRAVRTAGLYRCEGHVKINHQALKLTDSYLHNYLVRHKKRGSDFLSIKSSRTARGECAWVESAFFIAKTSRKDKQGKIVYGLYEKFGHAPRVEMVEQVENMHVAYTEWLSGKKKWVTHKYSEVVNWSRVRAVSVELLFRSSQRVYNQQPYWFGGSWHTVKQHAIHQVWRYYVCLREK